jgi:hypothetical protein
MPYWKNEEKCFEEAKLEGKDWHNKKVLTHWPRDMPHAQTMYLEWLKKVKDPDTGEFYHQRDKDGNIIKGTYPKHIIRQIVRIRTTDDKQYLYSNGYVLGYDAVGDPVREICSNPETWEKTGFMYKKEYDPNSKRIKTNCAGPNSKEIVYEMPWNEKNLKQLFDKRITPESARELGQKRISGLAFNIKDERNGIVRDVRDATGIEHKTLELFMKEFDYLSNADYLTPQQKAEGRQNAIDLGPLPRDAQVQPPHGQGQGTKPPSGTYS